MWAELGKMVLGFFRGKAAEQRADGKAMQATYEKMLATAERRLDRAEGRIDVLEGQVEECQTARMADRARIRTNETKIAELERLARPNDGKET